MSWLRPHRYEATTMNSKSCLAPALVVAFIVLTAVTAKGQSNPQAPFRSGQSMYIVAFRLIQYPIVLNQPPVDQLREYINLDLDAERKVRKRIEEWHFFKVAEKLKSRRKTERG